MIGMDRFRELEEQELVVRTLESACRFVEFYSDSVLNYYRARGYDGPAPKRFHPSVSDKLIIKELIEKRVKEIPPNNRMKGNIPVIAQRVLFWDYYPRYEEINKTISEIARLN